MRSIYNEFPLIVWVFHSGVHEDDEALHSLFDDDVEVDSSIDDGDFGITALLSLVALFGLAFFVSLMLLYQEHKQRPRPQ